MHPFSIPWKNQKTLRFSDVFRGFRKGALGTNGLMANEMMKQWNKNMWFQKFSIKDFFSKDFFAFNEEILHRIFCV